MARPEIYTEDVCQYYRGKAPVYAALVERLAPSDFVSHDEPALVVMGDFEHAPYDTAGLLHVARAALPAHYAGDVQLHLYGTPQQPELKTRKPFVAVPSYMPHESGRLDIVYDTRRPFEKVGESPDIYGQLADVVLLPKFDRLSKEGLTAALGAAMVAVGAEGIVIATPHDKGFSLNGTAADRLHGVARVLGARMVQYRSTKVGIWDPIMAFVFSNRPDLPEWEGAAGGTL